MGVVIEREWALTPLADPFLSAASLAAVLLLPYFCPSHTTSASASPFDVGTTPFLRFRRAFLFLFSLASGTHAHTLCVFVDIAVALAFVLVVPVLCSGGGIQSVFGEDEFARCGLGREQMASRLAAFAAATLFLGGVSGVISDKLGPRMACIFYWILQLAVGAMKSFSQLRCVWISNFILALSSSMFSLFRDVDCGGA